MIYIIAFYWIVAGFVFIMSIEDKKYDWFLLIFCMLFGGFVVPAKLIYKLVG